MRVVLAAGGLWALVGSIAVAQAPDPFTGTWTLNVGRSTMVSPATASKSETVTYRHVNGEEIYTSDAITAKGEKEHTDYRGVYDGPFGTIKTTIDGKTVSEGALQLRKLDPRTRLRISMRKDGTLSGIIVRRLAEDGRSITSSILRFDADGRMVVHETRVFEKQDDPFHGTWRLNFSKSTMQQTTASKSEVIHYRINGNEEDFLSDAVTSKGEPESIKYAAVYDDGKGYPFSITIAGKVTNPGAATMVRKIDTWTRERYNVRDGKPVLASRRVVSKDGKMLTITILRIDAQGKESVSETRVFDKQ